MPFLERHSGTAPVVPTQYNDGPTVAQVTQGLAGPLSNFLAQKDMDILGNIFTRPISNSDIKLFQNVDDIRETILKLLKLQLNLPSEVADLLLSPFDSLSALIPYEGTLDTSLIAHLKDMQLLTTLQNMTNDQINLIFDSLGEIRSKLSFFNKNDDGLFALPMLMENNEVIAGIRGEIRDILFNAEKNVDGFISFIPSFLSDLIYVRDISTELGSQLESIFGRPFENRAIIHLLQSLPMVPEGSVDFDFSGPDGAQRLFDGSFLNRVLATKKALVSEIFNWKAATYQPITAISQEIVNFAKNKASFIISLTTALPIFTAESSIAFLMKVRELGAEGMMVKVQVLDLILSMPIEFTQKFLTFLDENSFIKVLEYPTLDEMPEEIRSLFTFPIEEFPGGYEVFYGLFSEMRNILVAWRKYADALGYNAVVFPFEMFADLTREFLHYPIKIAAEIVDDDMLTTECPDDLCAVTQ